jgi:hypothetical protein
MPSSRLALIAALCLSVPGVVAAQEDGGAPASAPATSPAPAAAPTPAPGLGLVLDLGISSAYVFRGYNMFFAAPSVTWSIPWVAGLSVGYWGAYQLAGSNLRQAMDAGVGAESDFLVTYTRTVARDFSLGVGFTAYVFPAADRGVAGTSVPTYLEPAIAASLSRVVDLGLKVSYYHGVQEAVSAYRYTYFNPTVGKTLPLSARLSLALAASFGYKLFNERTTPTSKLNTFDVLVSAAVPITVTKRFYVKPAVSWAWTNFPDRSAGSEMVVFGSVNLGASF